MEQSCYLTASTRLFTPKSALDDHIIAGLMIVPDYWAEARKQHRSSGGQITVRRFGWSTSSEADALAMAEKRADEALGRILSGEKLDRRERKAAYNGAVGIPIREEVLLRHGQEVITRNSYGAHCLNTPRALFADVDFSPRPRTRVTLAVFAIFVVLSALVGVFLQSRSVAFGMLLASAFLVAPFVFILRRVIILIQGGHERVTKKRLQAFLAQNPSWNVRLYRTPGGIRLLATHQPFEASSPPVLQFFSAVGTDPLYMRMCRNQQCFRARLTAKPWRIGVEGRMRPRPGIWPVRPERLQARREWVSKYEQAAAAYAACHFIESIGSGKVHPEIGGVVELHDRETRANNSALSMA